MYFVVMLLMTYFSFDHCTETKCHVCKQFEIKMVILSFYLSNLTGEFFFINCLLSLVVNLNNASVIPQF